MFNLFHFRVDCLVDVGQDAEAWLALSLQGRWQTLVSGLSSLLWIWDQHTQLNGTWETSPENAVALWL